MTENTVLAQVTGNYYDQCLWSKLLIVCLPLSLQLQLLFIFIIMFWLPSHIFTGSYPALFKLIYQSCWTRVLY